MSASQHGLFLTGNVLFWKKRTFKFFLVFGYLPSVNIATNTYFSAISLIIHPQAFIDVLEKRLFEFLKAPSQHCFEEIVVPKFFWNFSVKHHVGVLFNYTLRFFSTFSKSLFKAAILREPSVSCKKELYHRLYLKNFFELWKHAKLKVVVCRRAIYLKGTVLQNSSWRCFEISKTPLRNLISSSFLVALQPAGCNFANPDKRESLGISGRATFQNIPIHVVESSVDL